MIIHGNRPELLRQLLVQWFQAHPLGVLEEETILVQSNGMAQWLNMALASHDNGVGIATLLDMSLPSRFVWRAYRSVLGYAAVPEISPFDKTLLIWRLMRLLPLLVEKPGYEPLQRFLSDDAVGRKRYQLADNIADLLDQYQVYRADWLSAWAEQQDSLLNHQGKPQPLEPNQRWQAQLWRALLEDLGEEAHPTSRAAIHQRFMEAVHRLEQRPLDLPRRLSVFGLSSLPQQSLDVLRALSRFTQVVVYVHNPCAYYWADIQASQDIARHHVRHHRPTDPRLPSTDPLADHAHPLLASWGKQGQDFITLLDTTDQPHHYRAQFESIGQRIDLFEDPGSDTHLHQFQHDILNLTTTSERQQQPWQVSADDDSICFHVAHSIQREVEILHDQLLALLQREPVWQPRDIIVMVPDMDIYAPSIAAVWGQIPTQDARHIPYSMADSIAHHQIPLVCALESLLNLTESRLTVSDMLDLLDVAALRQRFGIEQEDLPLLRRWISQTTIRWGLDDQHRTTFIPQPLAQNSWLDGLQQMLLGYAMGQDPTGRADYHWHDIEPYGEVSGLDAVLVGSLSRLLTSLQSLNQQLSEAVPPATWGVRLHCLLRDFFTDTSPEETAQLLQWHASLDQWAENCLQAQLSTPLSRVVVRDYWLTQINQSQQNQRFMAGRVTFATLMPMRTIPFRLVCLLGLNDGDYPRPQHRADFDLMRHEHRPGDRSRREDDHYLFLEALLSARDKLYLSWIGHNIHDATPRHPSALIHQLRDHLNRCWVSVSADNPVSAMTFHHPMQPFHRDYFTQDNHPSLFTYAHEWERRPSTPIVAHSTPLPVPSFELPISLTQLTDFLKDPVKTFYRQSLGVFLPSGNEDNLDQEPFELNSLELWQRRDELIVTLRDTLKAVPMVAPEPVSSLPPGVPQQLARFRRRGQLPVGAQGELTEARLVAPLGPMIDDYRNARTQYPQPCEALRFSHLTLCQNREVTIQCVIDDCFSRPTDERTQTDAPRQRIQLLSHRLIKNQQPCHDRLLGAWVVHLAAHVANYPMTARLIGLEGSITLPLLDRGWAEAQWSALIEGYVTGLCYPLPLAPKTGFVWLVNEGKLCHGAVNEGVPKAIAKARTCYEQGSFPEAQKNPYIQWLYPTFEALWADGQFTTWCAQLYAPLFDTLISTPLADISHNPPQS